MFRNFGNISGSSTEAGASTSELPSKRRRLMNDGHQQPSRVIAPTQLPHYSPREAQASSSRLAPAAPTGVSAGQEKLSPRCKLALLLMELHLLVEEHGMNQKNFSLPDVQKMDMDLYGNTLALFLPRQHLLGGSQALIGSVREGKKLYEKIKEVQECSSDVAAYKSTRESVQEKVEGILPPSLTKALENGNLVPRWDGENQKFQLIGQAPGVPLTEIAVSGFSTHGDAGLELYRQVRDYMENSASSIQEQALMKNIISYQQQVAALFESGSKMPWYELEGKWVKCNDGDEYQLWHKGSDDTQPKLKAANVDGELLEKVFLLLRQSYINARPYAKAYQQQVTALFESEIKMPVSGFEGIWVKGNDGAEYQLWHRESDNTQPKIKAVQLDGKVLENIFLHLRQSYINMHPYAKVKFQVATDRWIKNQNNNNNPLPLNLIKGIRGNESTNFPRETEKITSQDLDIFLNYLRKEKKESDASPWLGMVDTLPKYSKLMQEFLNSDSRRDMPTYIRSLNYLRRSLFGDLPSEKMLRSLRNDSESRFRLQTDEEFERSLEMAAKFDMNIASRDLFLGPIDDGDHASKRFVNMIKAACTHVGDRRLIKVMHHLRRDVHPLLPLDKELDDAINKYCDLGENSRRPESVEKGMFKIANALGSVAISLGKSSEEVIEILKNWDAPGQEESRKKIEKEMADLGVRTAASPLGVTDETKNGINNLRKAMR